MESIIIVSDSLGNRKDVEEYNKKGVELKVHFCPMLVDSLVNWFCIRTDKCPYCNEEIGEVEGGTKVMERINPIIDLNKILSDFDKAVDHILVELHRAQTKFPPFHSTHEGYAVIKEELDELWDFIRSEKDPYNPSKELRHEAIQVAAMAFRFILDLCSSGKD